MMRLIIPDKVTALTSAQVLPHIVILLPRLLLPRARLQLQQQASAAAAPPLPPAAAPPPPPPPHAQAISTALVRKFRTGEGAAINLSMLDAVVAFSWSRLRPPSPPSSCLPSSLPSTSPFPGAPPPPYHVSHHHVS
jgi:hypothetical protein